MIYIPLPCIYPFVHALLISGLQSIDMFSYLNLMSQNSMESKIPARPTPVPLPSGREAMERTCSRSRYRYRPRFVQNFPAPVSVCSRGMWETSCSPRPCPDCLLFFFVFELVALRRNLERAPPCVYIKPGKPPLPLPSTPPIATAKVRNFLVSVPLCKT